MTTCKKCDIRFRKTSSLRKHQWKEHREYYANTGHRGKDIVKVDDTVPPLLASGLLEALKKQKIFINDVVSLVEAMINK